MSQAQIKIVVFFLLALLVGYWFLPETPIEKRLMHTGEAFTKYRSCPALGLCFTCEPTVGTLGVDCKQQYSANCPGRRLSEYQEETFMLYFSGNNGNAEKEVKEIRRVRDLTQCEVYEGK